MGKKSGVSILGVAANAVDPTLDALFSMSAGPVKAPSRPRYAQLYQRQARNRAPVLGQENESESGGEDVESSSEDEDDDEGSQVGGESSSDSENSTGQEGGDVVAASKTTTRARNRKRKKAEEELEDGYLQRLVDDSSEDEGEQQPSSKRLKAVPPRAVDSDSDDAPPLVHESLAQAGAAADGGPEAELERAARTVFLGNVSTDAITSKAARRKLVKHLESVLRAEGDADVAEEEGDNNADEDGEDSPDEKDPDGDDDDDDDDDSDGGAKLAATKTGKTGKAATPPSQRLESLRFRSVAFSTLSLPKRAAYATGALMSATTAASHAYAVYPTPASARLAVERLNGTVVLGRHLRADGVAHPARVDHRRCVFVGNVGFVDDESVYETKKVVLAEEDEEGGVEDAGGRKMTKKKDAVVKETTRRRKAKLPSDAEEGLWRVFGEKAGRVESVRVVRDPKTRVGKGFAYVQFYSADSVESALLLDGHKFPPMLPRLLRVVRAKAPHKTALAAEKRSQVKKAPGGAPGAGKRRDNGVNHAKGPGGGGGKAAANGGVGAPGAGREGKLLGLAAAARERRRELGRGEFKVRGNGGRVSAGGGVVKRRGEDDGKKMPFKSPEDIVFEGMRASEKDGKPKGMNFHIKKPTVPGGGKGRKDANKASKRGTKRAAEWRKSKAGN